MLVLLLVEELDFDAFGGQVALLGVVEGELLLRDVRSGRALESD